jgi:2-methylcitrate dehydratase PrpD
MGFTSDGVKKGITSDYIDFCLNLKYEDLPAEVVEKVKQLGLDFIGTAAYGTQMGSSKAMVEFLRGLNLKGDCTVMGTSMKCPAQYAVLGNGAFVKSNELDDVENSSSLHPGAAIWPVVLALGEQYGLSGKSLIPAVVLGYETIIRLGQAINYAVHYARGFHPSSTCGHFAATVAAAKLLKLNKQQMMNALGISGSQTSGSFRYIIAGSWTKALHAGWAAHSGILAAHLAKTGFDAPDDIFEGKYGFFEAYSSDTHPEYVLKGLGKDYEIIKTGIKIHTACRHEHPGLDCVLSIVRQHDLKPADIKRVDIYMIGNAFRLVVEPEKEKRDPENVVVSMHSMYFGAAQSILKRSAFVEEHAERWIHDPQVLDVIKRIYCHHDTELDKLLPEKFPARAVIETKDGRKLEAYFERPYGDGLNPMPYEEVRTKYASLAKTLYSAKRIKEIEEKMRQFEKIQDFGEVVQLLAKK